MKGPSTMDVVIVSAILSTGLSLTLILNNEYPLLIAVILISSYIVSRLTE